MLLRSSRAAETRSCSSRCTPNSGIALTGLPPWNESGRTQWPASRWRDSRVSTRRSLKGRSAPTTPSSRVTPTSRLPARSRPTQFTWPTSSAGSVPCHLSPSRRVHRALCLSRQVHRKFTSIPTPAKPPNLMDRGRASLTRDRQCPSRMSTFPLSARFLLEGVAKASLGSVACAITGSKTTKTASRVDHAQRLHPTPLEHEYVE